MATNSVKNEAAPKRALLAHDHFACRECGAEMVFAKPPPHSLARIQWDMQLCTRCFDIRREFERSIAQ
jgi:hypothetical protein